MLNAGIPHSRTLNVFRFMITFGSYTLFTLVVFFIVTILCLVFSLATAHAATQSEITKAIAYVEKRTVEFATILATDDEAYYVKIRELTLPACGRNIGVNVSRLAIGSPWGAPTSEVVTMTSVHITIGKEDAMRILMDLNADGAVDQVVPSSAGTREAMQPEFDRIITCVATLK